LFYFTIDFTDPKTVKRGVGNTEALYSEC